MSNNSNKMHNPLTFNPKIPKIQTEERKLRNYHHLQPPYQNMNWKYYTIVNPKHNNQLHNLNNNINQINIMNNRNTPIDRLSDNNSIRQKHSPSYYYDTQYFYDGIQNVSNLSARKLREDSNLSARKIRDENNLSARKIREQNLRLSGISHKSRKQEHALRVKEQAMRRVKMLQQKVMPLLTSDRRMNNIDQDIDGEYGLEWQLRMEQKLVKLESTIQRLRNEMEIKYEKRLIEMERDWSAKIDRLLGVESNGIGVQYRGEEEQECRQQQQERAQYYDENRGLYEQGSYNNTLHEQNHQSSGQYGDYSAQNHLQHQLQ